MKFGTFSFGVPLAAGWFWIFGRHFGIDMWLIVLALSLGGGWLWSWIVWHAFESDFQRLEAESRQNETHDA
jgi:hypothetical protein